MPEKFTIKLRSLGPILGSFKNRKRVCNGRLVTEKKTKAKMQQYIAAIESATFSTCQTIGVETQTAPSLRSLIASLLPADDCFSVLPESDGYRTVRVPKGEEGVDIIIEQLP